MNWKALKNYKCPKDGAPLKDIGQYHACTKCIFSINKAKFDSIVSDQYKKKPASDNFSDLQIMGHGEMSEGFLPDEENGELPE